MAHVCGKFVSRKIHKVRWRPVRPDSFEKSEYFATGSWDDLENTINIWHYQQSEPLGDEEECNLGKQEPKVLTEHHVRGDVTDLQYLNSEVLISSSSNGSISLFKHNDNLQVLEPIHTWDNLHKFKCSPAPCTTIATQNEEIVSVGEDGCICILNTRDKSTRVIDADSSTLTAVSYLKQNQVMVANSLGHLNVWDLRTNTESPVQTMLTPGEGMLPVFCIAQHPTQPQLVASGGGDGSLVIWDLRQDSNLATLRAHDGAVMEVKFHPTSPHHMFTCSMDGTLWHWDASVLANTPAVIKPTSKSAPAVTLNPWLNCGSYQHQLEIAALLPPVYQPINSLDILEDTVVCGADNEAIYLIRMGIF